MLPEGNLFLCKFADDYGLKRVKTCQTKGRKEVKRRSFGLFVQLSSSPNGPFCVFFFGLFDRRCLAVAVQGNIYYEPSTRQGSADWEMTSSDPLQSTAWFSQANHKGCALAATPEVNSWMPWWSIRWMMRGRTCEAWELLFPAWGENGKNWFKSCCNHWWGLEWVITFIYDSRFTLQGPPKTDATISRKIFLCHWGPYLLRFLHLQWGTGTVETMLSISSACSFCSITASGTAGCWVCSEQSPNVPCQYLIRMAGSPGFRFHLRIDSCW